jgi:serine phosphatase RsbU (regulator of sigma subunit)
MASELHGMTSTLGRSVAFATIAIKVILVLAGLLRPATRSQFEYLDRSINFFLIILAGIWLYRFTRLARSGALWRLSRQLLLSYVLIGAVPLLLLVTFSLLAFLLVFFDVSAYVVQNRFADMAVQASTFARATLDELERTPAQKIPEVVRRRQAALEEGYPGSSVRVVPTAGDPPCGAASPLPPSPAGTLPRWVSCEGFSGVVDAKPVVARAAVLPMAHATHAVIVDVPVAATLAASLEGTGIEVGQQQRTLFNTATFLTYTDWETGATHERPLPMSVNIARLYKWLGRSQGADVNFNQVLFFGLLGVGFLLLVIEIVALGNGLGFARSITTSVDDLFHGTLRVKEGNFQQAIAVRSADQLGELAASFNDMTTRIQGLLVEQNEKRRLEEELRIARTIQMSLLPQGNLSVPGLSVSALCSPAREVGGDYYDLLPLEDGRLGLLIADVAGKGTSAALYMAELKGLMLSLSRIHTSPRTLLMEANHIIAQHLDSRSFITMIYAIIDVKNRQLTCARAGHTPFIRVPCGSAEPCRAEVLTPDGMVLGLNLDNGERFDRLLTEMTIPLTPGDLFFFFTDGISEAMNADGSCFGESRVTALLEAHAQLTTAEIRDVVRQEIEGFVGTQPQHDDITMVILKVE